MRPITFLWAVLAVTPFTSVTAQYSVQVKPGDQVRVTHQCSDSVQQTNGKTGTGCRKDTGIFASGPADSIVLGVDEQGTPLVLPVASVTRLEVMRGRKPWGTGRGAVVGALVGAPLVVVVALATYEECVVQEVQFFFSNCTFADTQGQVLLVGAIVGGAGGALLGAILGSAIKSARWEEVPLDQLRVSLAPQPDGGFGLGLSFLF